MAITRGFGKILIFSKDIWQDHPCCVLIVSTEFIENNPSKVKSLLKAHIKSINYIKNNFEDAVNIGVKYTGMDKKTIELALNNIQFDSQINFNKAIEYVQFLNKLGYTSITNPRAFVQSLILNQ
jgi:NitT/TauT family transport system substrate-binding protein